ncbi:MAG: hypothetical protein QME51_01600, partial [Planctomycetota bacterium]|nr:hypothetical protein [Planctomycetota bacterium]
MANMTNHTNNRWIFGIKNSVGHTELVFRSGVVGERVSRPKGAPAPPPAFGVACGEPRPGGREARPSGRRRRRGESLAPMLH